MPSETQHGECDADPEPRREVAPVELAEVGEQDADDESGLETFAQPDEVVSQHEGEPFIRGGAAVNIGKACLSDSMLTRHPRPVHRRPAIISNRAADASRVREGRLATIHCDRSEPPA